MGPTRSRKDRIVLMKCQMAIESKLLTLVDEAAEAGWHRDEVLIAIVEVADNLSLVRSEDIALTIDIRLRRLLRP